MSTQALIDTLITSIHHEQGSGHDPINTFKLVAGLELRHRHKNGEGKPAADLYVVRAERSRKWGDTAMRRIKVGAVTTSDLNGMAQVLLHDYGYIRSETRSLAVEQLNDLMTQDLSPKSPTERLAAWMRETVRSASAAMSLQA